MFKNNFVKYLLLQPTNNQSTSNKCMVLSTLVSFLTNKTPNHLLPRAFPKQHQATCAKVTHQIKYQNTISNGQQRLNFQIIEPRLIVLYAFQFYIPQAFIQETLGKFWVSGLIESKGFGFGSCTCRFSSLWLTIFPVNTLSLPFYVLNIIQKFII